MSINSTAQTALDGKSILVGSWLEIEGIPNAYGTFAHASFFSGRSSINQFDSIKSLLVSRPKTVDQSIDTLKGGNLSVGQCIFEILDHAGEATGWTNLASPSRYLVGSVTASGTTFNVNDATGLSVNQYLYIGSETVKITGIVGTALTVTRGMYRSTAMAYPSVFPIGTSVYTMANRRVWYYQVFDSGSKTVGTWSLTGAGLDAIKVLRFSGVLRSCHVKDGEPYVYVLTADSVDREIDREVFRNLRTFRLDGTAIKDAENSGSQPCQVAGWPGFTPGYDRLFNFPASLFTLNENIILQIDDEIFAGTVTSLTPPELQLKARALYGSSASVHNEGAVVREIVPICAKSNQTNTGQNVPWHELASKFNAIPLYPGDVGPDHPVILALTVLTSTGAGTNFDASGRNCDRLPADWGLGISASRIDWYRCERAAREDPALRFGGFVTQPMNATDFLRQVLVFGGYYFHVATGDLFTIKRLRPPLPDETTKAITESVRIRNHQPAWDANWSGAVREVVFRYGWDLRTGKYKRIAVFKLNDADIFSKSVARTLTFESKFIYPGGSNIPGDITPRVFDVDAWLLHRRDYFLQRYAKPPPIIKERVDLSFIGVELGDLCTVTKDWIPNLSGGRGASAMVGEVIGKTIDDESRTVELTLLMTGYQLGQYRYIAPSHTIQTIADLGGSFEIEDINITNSGYDAGTSGAGGDDMRFTTQGGTSFALSDQQYLYLWQANFYQYEQVEVLNSSASMLEVTKPVWFTPVVGDFLTTLDFDTIADPTLYDVFGLFAVGGEIITGQAPHRLFPA